MNDAVNIKWNAEHNICGHWKFICSNLGEYQSRRYPITLCQRQSRSNLNIKSVLLIQYHNILDFNIKDCLNRFVLGRLILKKCFATSSAASATKICKNNLFCILHMKFLKLAINFSCMNQKSWFSVMSLKQFENNHFSVCHEPNKHALI